MIDLGDIWTQFEPSAAMLKSAVAAGFGVREVMVWPANEVSSLRGDVIIQVDHEPGDFPCHLGLIATSTSGIGFMPEARFMEAVAIMARQLNQSIMTGVGAPYDDLWVVTPGGERIVVSLDDDIDDAGVLTTESRQRWQAAIAQVSAAD